MAEVTLRKVRKEYPGGVLAVKDVDLDVADGEFMVLVGPSGCGKSTTLRMVAGLEEISGGTVSIGDAVVNEVEPKDRDIAMVFQSYALYPHMNVYDNLAFGLKLHGIPKGEIDGRVKSAADVLGLGEYLYRKPKALSGGQRQRVAMGRAIVRQPKVFLFDEPLSNLDAKMRTEMRKEIIKLHKRIGATMMYVTHDQVEAMTLGDRICVMKDGLIQQVGTPGDVFEDPANLFVAGFIGSPPMNFFDGELRLDGRVCSFVSGSMRVEIPAEIAERVEGMDGMRVVMGLRPSAFVLRRTLPDDGEGGCPVWRGRVEVLEMLGDSALAHVDMDGVAVTLAVNPHDLPDDEDEVLEFCPLMNRSHFFDVSSGRNVTAGVKIAGRRSMRKLTRV